MHLTDKKFRIAFYIIVIVTFIIFLIVYIIQSKEMNYRENFLASASVSGFVGLFGQFGITILQEYYKRKVYNVCLVCKKSQFLASIVQGAQEVLMKRADVRLDIF